MSEEKDIGLDYPDLSDNEPEAEAPRKLPNPNLIRTPMLFGGRAFVPPPPPPGTPKPQQAYQPPLVHQQLKSGDQTHNRERRNCVYVRNIPKHFNQSGKLTTFFKNQGAINEIRTNPQQLTAFVRFAKEESAIKFVASKKSIFNRSYITYSLNEKEDVPAELVRERENDEGGKIKRPTEIELKQLKDKMETILADKFRALYFLENHVHEEELRRELILEEKECREVKERIGKMGEEECRRTSVILRNEYDWTLCFQLSQKQPADKKQLLFQHQSKFGPVAALQLNQVEGPNEDHFQYVVKLTFLSVRHSWEYYCAKAMRAKEEEEKYVIEVEGWKMRNLFSQGAISRSQPDSNEADEREAVEREADEREAVEREADKQKKGAGEGLAVQMQGQAPKSE